LTLPFACPLRLPPSPAFIAVDEVIETATLGRVAIYRRWVVAPDGQEVATDFVPRRDEHAFRQHDSLSSAIRQMRMERVAA